LNLLHTTDLHGDLAGLEAAADLAAASAPCILAVSGDVVEWPMRCLEKDEWMPCMDTLFKISDRLAASGSCILACSGNHDAWASAGRVPWFGLLRPGFAADALQPARSSHEVQVGDGLAIVTCFPWRNDGGPSSLSAVADFAEAGKRLREPFPDSPWIWLHHSAPGGTPVGVGAAEDEANAIMEVAAAYRPSIVLCGHVHGSPWLDGGAPFWTDPRSGALFSNPGRRQTGICLSTIKIGTGTEPPVCNWRPNL
jgi:hypothetical protein